MSDSAGIFDEAFRPMTIEYLDDDKKIANVTVDGVTQCVTGYYCAHCRWGPGRGEAWCEHKERAFGGTALESHYEEYARELAEQYAERMGA